MNDDSERRNGVPPDALGKEVLGNETAETASDAPNRLIERSEGTCSTEHKKVPSWVLKGEKPKGRPSKAQIRAEKKLKAKTAKNPKNWGGRRVNAGRKVTGTAKKQTMVRMDKDLAEKLESLPQGKRSEYVRQALDLMKDIQPPEKFLASGK